MQACEKDTAGGAEGGFVCGGGSPYLKCTTSPLSSVTSASLDCEPLSRRRGSTMVRSNSTARIMPVMGAEVMWGGEWLRRATRGSRARHAHEAATAVAAAHLRGRPASGW